MAQKTEGRRRIRCRRGVFIDEPSLVPPELLPHDQVYGERLNLRGASAVVVLRQTPHTSCGPSPALGWRQPWMSLLAPHKDLPSTFMTYPPFRLLLRPANIRRTTSVLLFCVCANHPITTYVETLIGRKAFCLNKNPPDIYTTRPIVQVLLSSVGVTSCTHKSRDIDTV